MGIEEFELTLIMQQWLEEKELWPYMAMVGRKKFWYFWNNGISQINSNAYKELLWSSKINQASVSLEFFHSLTVSYFPRILIESYYIFVF